MLHISFWYITPVQSIVDNHTKDSKFIPYFGTGILWYQIILLGWLSIIRKISYTHDPYFFSPNIIPVYQYTSWSQRIFRKTYYNTFSPFLFDHSHSLWAYSWLLYCCKIIYRDDPYCYLTTTSDSWLLHEYMSTHQSHSGYPSAR